ncbi:MAG TPA: hypothetical protein PLC07_11235 [Bacillota bacterium]|nr:hypothetical protein [Bacillota bacterium]
MRMKYSFLLLVIFIMASIAFADTDVLKNSLDASSVPAVAFSSKRGGNFDIYTMRVDGSDLRKLTQSKDDDIKPQWSPDGTRIMYLSKSRNATAIVVMNKDGSGGKKIVADCVEEYLPAWSPDSSKILFVAKSRAKKGIFVINADGSQLIRLSNVGAEGTCPSWSPDGSRILYLERCQDDMYIYSIKPDGTDRQRITKEKGRYQGAVWSPDGTKIAYISPQSKLTGNFNRIYVINSDGSNLIEIAEGSKRVEDIEYPDQICWSPDGMRMAFSKVVYIDAIASETGRPRFIYEYGVNMADAAGNDHSQLLVKTGAERVNPVWSPDGTKLAVLSQSKLWVYDLKSGMDQEFRINVALPLSPIRWAPNGDRLIVAGKNSSFQKSGLYLISLNGDVSVLSSANDYDPVWAPN